MNSHDTAVLIQLTAIRKTIHELAFAVGVLMIGFLGTRWWADAAMAAAVAVTMGALIGYLDARSGEKRLQKAYWREADQEDARREPY